VLLERIPELYVGFLGILKVGAIVQPLFSAFGEEAFFQRADDSKAIACITQHKHLGKVRKVRDRLPELKLVIVVDHDESKRRLREGEVAYSMMDRALDEFPVAPTYAESPACSTTRAGRRGSRRGPSTSTRASSRNT